MRAKRVNFPVYYGWSGYRHNAQSNDYFREFAGMDIFDLVTSARALQKQLDKKEGHFYYSKEGALGNTRRKELAEELYKFGLR